MTIGNYFPSVGNNILRLWNRAIFSHISVTICRPIVLHRILWVLRWGRVKRGSGKGGSGKRGTRWHGWKTREW